MERSRVSPLRPAVLALLLAAAPATESHLVAGADAFRAEAYEKALVEFRVAGALGSAEASWYAAAALLKLGRAEDAVEAFVLAERSNRAAGDALLEVYRGQACYAAQLLLCADRWFESAESRAGPRLAPQLRALRNAIRDALRPEQIEPAIDRFLDRASALQRTRPALAFAFAEEAAALASRSPAQHRQAEATALTGRLVAPATRDGR
jgi:tetratricopeptide (TPR) repeat protein